MYQALEIMDSEIERSYFGWLNFRPKSLQVFNSVKWAVVFMSMGSITQGIAVNGLLHYFIPMIERQFQLTSTKSGLMSGSYDIASLLCLIPVTFYGGQKRAKRPLYLGIGVLIIGTGSFLFALPAFLAGPYVYNESSRLCVGTNFEIKKIERDYTFHYILLVIGNFLHGAGATPLFTLGVTYLDENAPPNKSSIYLGIYYMMAILGPSLAYLAGGSLATLYVDPPWLSNRLEVDVSYISRPPNITPDNPNWVGCWWLGFLFCSVLALISALPILGLPRELEGNEAKKENLSLVRFKEMSQITTFAGLPNALCRVVRKLKFDFITCAGFCEGVVISGMGSFFPKILEQQMDCSSQSTAIIMGAFGTPCALFGVMIGGYMVKHYRLNLDQMLLFCLIMIILAILCSTGLFLTCGKVEIAGFHVSYPMQPSVQNDVLISDCNKHCHCQAYTYDPICGADNINYFSPCFAGCKASYKLGLQKVYHECKCINNSGDNFDAVHYRCSSTCPVFYTFIILLCFYQVFTFSACIPSLTATLSSVDEELKSLAMGIQWIAARLLGTVPGPVIFGMIFDKSCILWNNSFSGNETGVCLMYDHRLLSVYLGCIVIFFKCAEATFFTIAFLVRTNV